MTGPYATGAPLYWKAGFTCPLPLAGKVLTVKGYTGHDGALVSWPDLQAWIETRSESNIGLRAAGWIGLDVDAYGAKVGAQSWASALAELGELPATVSSTARGPGQPSRIYLYRVPSAAVFDDAQRRFGEAFGPNVDVIHRSHRYIAVWPSLNPDAGGAPYRWYDPAGAVVDGVPELGQLPDLPEPWLEFLAGGTAASSERKAASPTLPGDPFTSPGHTPWTRSQMLAQVNPLLERLAANGRSGRTALDDLMAAALVTYRFVPAFMTREKADEVLLGHLLERDQADGASDPTTWKWSARHELEKAWKDRAYEAEAADDPDPLDAPAGDDPGGAERVDLELAAEVARQRRQRDARLLLDAEETARQADDAAVAALTEQLLTSAALDDIPDLEPLIEGWLFRDSMARLIGKSGTYKSFVALDMACHVAAGTEWFGYATGIGPVVYVVAEGARGVRRRVRAWEAKHLESLGDKLLILPRPVQMVGPEWLAFVGACKAVGAVMVVLDTQARVTVGVEENSAREMGQVVAMGERLRVDTGACVMLIHHTGHAGEHGRGSTSVYGALQTELSLERTADRRVSLKASKQKDHDELGPVNLKLEPCCDSLVLVNLDGMDDVSAGTVEESIRSITMASGSHAERAAIVLHGLWRGGSGATRAELRKACAEQYELAGLAALKPTSFTYAFTKMEEAGWLREGRSASRFILSEPGCRHLGVEYVGPMDWDEES